jgi:hypothetical protein
MSSLKTVAKSVYSDALDLNPGFQWHYNGYTFEKVDPGRQLTSGNHSEIKMVNEAGKQVALFSVEAFEDFESLYKIVNKIVEYNPDDLQDWLDHRRKERDF